MSETPLLHTSPGSHHARRVTMLAAELGMELATRIVDVRPPGMGGENESPTYLALNPNGQVPVLTHGDLVLPESNAIMSYLCALHGETSWLPSDPAARARVLAWQFWQAAQLSPVADGLMGEQMGRPMLGQEPDAERVATLIAAFHRWAKVLDETLARHPYLTGEVPTCADLSVASALMYHHAVQLPIGEHEVTAEWFARMQARPSWQATEPPAW